MLRTVSCLLVLDFATGGLQAGSGSLFDRSQGTIVISNSKVQCGAAANIFGGNTPCASDNAEDDLVFADSTPGTVDFVFFKAGSPVTLNNVQLFANGDSGVAMQNGGLPREFAEFRFLQVDSSNNPIKVLVDFVPPHPESAKTNRLATSATFATVTGQYFRAEWVQGDYALTGPRIDGLQGFLLSTPAINANGIVNNGSFAATSPLAPGSIAAVFGSNLTDGTSCLEPTCFPTFRNGKLNTILDGAQVMVNETLVPIFYASPSQLGIQIPTELTANLATVKVTVGNQTSASQTISLASTAPGIFFTLIANGKSLAALNHVDGSAITSLNPAQPGELVLLYATGLGALKTLVPTGALPPAGGDSTVAPVTISFDGVSVTPDFAGSSGCCVGENQVNVRIPASTRSGDDIPVVLTIGTTQSNTVLTSVKAK